jgi:hypothetical protein
MESGESEVTFRYDAQAKKVLFSLNIKGSKKAPMGDSSLSLNA